MYSDLLPNEPVLMPFQSKSFNNDFNVANEFLKLRDKFNVKTVLEAGSCVGGSTKWMANNFQNVITTEINETFRNFCLERTKEFSNVKSYLANTTDVLAEILKSLDSNIIIFLDDHWNEFFPLIDELKIIKQSGLKPVIIVHDCLVPNQPKLGYDSYNGVDISYATMKPYLDDIYGENGYEYHYNSDETSTEVKRGGIYIYPKVEQKEISKSEPDQKREIINGYFSRTIASNLSVLCIGTDDDLRSLMIKGCKAFLIEPSQTKLGKLSEFYNGYDNVKLFPFAIDTNNGIVDFEEDDGSSKVMAMDFYTFTVTANHNRFELIKIDSLNGKGYEILKQINLPEANCEMIIINYDNKYKEMYTEYANNSGYSLIFENKEALIFTKN